MITTRVSHILVLGDRLSFWIWTDEPGSGHRRVTARLPYDFEDMTGRQQHWAKYDAMIAKIPTGRIQFPAGYEDTWQDHFDRWEMTSRELNELLDAHDARPKAGPS